MIVIEIGLRFTSYRLVFHDERISQKAFESLSQIMDGPEEDTVMVVSSNMELRVRGGDLASLVRFDVEVDASMIKQADDLARSIDEDIGNFAKN